MKTLDELQQAADRRAAAAGMLAGLALLAALLHVHVAAAHCASPSPAAGGNAGTALVVVFGDGRMANINCGLR